MILVLYSVDPQMARHVAMKSIVKDFPIRDEFNYVSFNMAVKTVNELASECEFLPIGTDRKCILATDCGFLAKGRGYKYQKDDGPEALLRYLKNPNDFIDLYLLVHAETVDEKNPLIQAAMKSGQVKGIPMPKPEEWIEYARKFLAAKGSPIDVDAARELVVRAENDYGRFINDLNKLANYANGEPITMKAILALIPPRIEDDTFALSNALTRGDVAKAIGIYRDLKQHSVDEIRLINTLAGQFVFMDEVAFLDGKGMSSFDIAKELGASPKRVEITVRNLYRMKLGALTRILEDLYATEKQILTGQVDAPFAFMRFLANFSIA